MAMSDMRKDAADAGGNAELIFEAAERAADKFMYVGGSQREAFVQGFIDGATLMATILRPPTSCFAARSRRPAFIRARS